MTPAERARRQRREKETAYLRTIGQAVRVPPGPAMAHAQALHARGMTGAQIAALAGVSKATAQDLVRGHRTKDRGGYPIKDIDRDVAEAVLGVRYREPEVRGSDIDSIGVRRRLQALTAIGYGSPAVATHLGCTFQMVSALTLDKGPVSVSTLAKVSAVYDKLYLTDPLENGLTRYSVARAKGTAQRRGYAPPMCWDVDTIDDPDAFPEWTGVCGTPQGVGVHKREGIPVCPACKSAAPTATRVFSPEKFKARRAELGYSLRELSDLIGCDNSTLRWWESGRSAPRTGRVYDRMLSVLDVTFEEISEEEQ